MYVCMSVRNGFTTEVYELTYSLRTLRHVPLLVRLSSRWKTWRRDDDARPENASRDTEDEIMKDDSTRVKEEELRVSSKGIHYASVVPLPPSMSFLRTLQSNPNNRIVDFPSLISPSKYAHVLLFFIGETPRTTPHNFALGDG